jgi:hypothetical protein
LISSSHFERSPRSFGGQFAIVSTIIFHPHIYHKKCRTPHVLSNCPTNKQLPAAPAAGIPAKDI